ncbi:DUF4157 domain-containing protein [Streptomyces sp. NPDC020898]|uniref:DUF4157 domain-containing protein n=1 Tax=Streptomyces sp. NPDC020898 TaxID=3365101 RepID=UPI0037B2D1A5
MEGRFGADFSDVRLHTGIAAQRSAAEIGAHAYTSGNHVVIGEGGGDRHTLAHELTHVIQQRQGPVSGTDSGSGLSISDPSDRFEREAEEQAHRVLQGPSPVQRKESAGATRQSGSATTTAAHVQRTHYEPGDTVTANPGFSVTLQATLNGIAIGTFSSETTPYSPGDHAEDQMVDEIESAIAGLYGKPAVTQALAAGQQGTQHTLGIRLTASPCSSTRGTCAKADRSEGCAERLIELAQRGYNGHTFTISVRAHHLYQPRLPGVDSKQASTHALSDMAAAGIAVTIG